MLEYKEDLLLSAAKLDKKQGDGAVIGDRRWSGVKFIGPKGALVAHRAFHFLLPIFAV